MPPGSQLTTWWMSQARTLYNFGSTNWFLHELYWVHDSFSRWVNGSIIVYSNSVYSLIEKWNIGCIVYIFLNVLYSLIPSTHKQRYSFVHTTQRQARVRLEDQG